MGKKKWRYVKTGPLSGHWIYGESDEDLNQKESDVKQIDKDRGVAPDRDGDGFLSSIFGNVGTALFGEDFGELNLGHSLKSWLDSMSGADLTNAQQQMNDYNSAEAQKQRDFASKQAELAFDRQVDFYEKYQSIGSQVKQFQDAGLNPALLAGGVSPSSSAPSSSAPSGFAASGSSPSSNPMALVSFVMQLAGIKSQIEKTQAETENIQSQTETQSVTRDKLRQEISESFSREKFNYSSIEVNNSRISEIASHIRSLDADVEVKAAEVRVALDSLETAIANRKYLTSKTSLNYEQIKEVKANIEYTAELLRGATLQNDFFDRVKHWRAKNEEMKAKNASVRERFLALGPILGISANRWSHWLSDSNMGTIGSGIAKKNLEKEMEYFLKFVENL